jgi:phosphoglycerate-specific signal transduction histidine kinase
MNLKPFDFSNLINLAIGRLAVLCLSCMEFFRGDLARTAKGTKGFEVIVGEKTLFASHNPYIFNVKPSFGRI